MEEAAFSCRLAGGAVGLSPASLGVAVLIGLQAPPQRHQQLFTFAGRQVPQEVLGGQFHKPGNMMETSQGQQSKQDQRVAAATRQEAFKELIAKMDRNRPKRRLKNQRMRVQIPW